MIWLCAAGATHMAPTASAIAFFFICPSTERLCVGRVRRVERAASCLLTFSAWLFLQLELRSGYGTAAGNGTKRAKGLSRRVAAILRKRNAAGCAVTFIGVLPAL